MSDKNIRMVYFVIIGLLLAIMAGCSSGNGDTKEFVENAISVKAMQLGLTSNQLTKSFTGTLEGEKQAVITCKISETVEKIYVTEGDRVKTDDILISLDRSGATSSYVQTKSVYKNAEKNYKKMEYLYGEGAVSEIEFDGAKTEYEVALANFTAAEKMVDIKSPISGTVTSIGVSVGDNLMPGQNVATVALIDKLRMKLGISDANIANFNEGDEVMVTVEAFNNQVNRGKVITVAQSADPVTRTFQVEIEIENSSGLLKPGMFARAQITVEKFENVLAIPRTAAVIRDNESYVFVLKGDRVETRKVKLGVEFNGSVKIQDGLSVSDTIIVVGQNYLDDGNLVKMVGLVNVNGEEITL
ncbi:MAG: efflux RND transporter periplasmic adaptor subunit [Candidatus Zixiibacteriota bacterium]